MFCFKSSMFVLPFYNKRMYVCNHEIPRVWLDLLNDSRVLPNLCLVRPDKFIMHPSIQYQIASG